MCIVASCGFEFKLIYFVIIQTVSISFYMSILNSVLLFKILKFVVLVLTFLKILFFPILKSVRFNIFPFHCSNPLLCSTFYISTYNSAIVLKSFRFIELFTFQYSFFHFAQLSDNQTFLTHKTQIRNFGGNSAMTCNGLVHEKLRV